MADVKVRLLRNKRWPHPNGPKRQPGYEFNLAGGMVPTWERAGLVERVKPISSKSAQDPEPEDDDTPTLAPAAAEAQGADAPAPEADDKKPPVRPRPTGSRKRKK